jgi:hypothetical protein
MLNEEVVGKDITGKAGMFMFSGANGQWQAMENEIEGNTGA